MRKRDWAQAHAERWSKSNHKFMASTPRVTRESLHDLNYSTRRQWSHEEVADAIIMVLCIVAMITLVVVSTADKIVRVFA